MARWKLLFKCVGQAVCAQGVRAVADLMPLGGVLYDVLGYTHQEIAATLRIPVGTSKSRLSVARRRLSRTFDAS